VEKRGEEKRREEKKEKKEKNFKAVCEQRFYGYI